MQAQYLPAPSTVYGVLATFGGIPSFNITQPAGLTAAEPLSACTTIQNKVPGELPARAVLQCVCSRQCVSQQFNRRSCKCLHPTTCSRLYRFPASVSDSATAPLLRTRVHIEQHLVQPQHLQLPVAACIRHLAPAPFHQAAHTPKHHMPVIRHQHCNYCDTFSFYVTTPLVACAAPTF